MLRVSSSSKRPSRVSLFGPRSSVEQRRDQLADQSPDAALGQRDDKVGPAAITSPYHKGAHQMILRILLLTVAFLGSTACSALASDDGVQEPAIMIDFATLEKTSKPNQWLVAPKGLLTQETADAEAPFFSQDAETVFAAVLNVVSNLPRSADIKSDKSAMTLSYVATVPVFGFKDDVDIAVLATDSGSTLAIYSRSRVGYSDFGVNQRRVESLLEAISAALAG